MFSDLRHKRPIVDGFEVDSDTEREGADLAAELVGAGSVSEGEWSDPESDLGDQVLALTHLKLVHVVAQ